MHKHWTKITIPPAKENENNLESANPVHNAQRTFAHPPRSITRYLSVSWDLDKKKTHTHHGACQDDVIFPSEQQSI